MDTPGTQYPNQYSGQPTATHQYHSDSHILMGLGVVLLCFGGAITHHHEVTMIGLALIVLSGFLD